MPTSTSVGQLKAALINFKTSVGHNPPSQRPAPAAKKHPKVSWIYLVHPHRGSVLYVVTRDKFGNVRDDGAERVVAVIGDPLGNEVGLDRPR